LEVSLQAATHLPAGMVQQRSLALGAQAEGVLDVLR
jgi:hypothetical protein